MRTCRTAGYGTFFLLLTLALYACSGSGGSGPGSGDGTAPTAAITFPGATASIATGHVIVRGTANDQGAIARVRVNGIDATSSDGFATWEATLDLPAGRNSLTVSTEDELGNRNTAAAVATVTVGPSAATGAGSFTLNSPRAIAVESTGQIIVLDNISWISRVVRVDPNTGTRTIVCDDAVGSGPMLRSEARGIAVEPSGGLVVVDAAPAVLGGVDNGRVVRVDPASGARTIVSENRTTGSGPEFNWIRGIAVEPTGQIIVFESSRVLRVDPASGARTIVSAATTGSGPPFDSLTAIAVEPTGQIVVTGGVTGGGYSVVRIDPRSGARTALISAPGPGYIPPNTHNLGWPFFRGIAVEPSGQIIVVDILAESILRGELVRIDPISKGRTVISKEIDFTDLGIAVEAPGRLVTLSGHSLLRVDLRNGAWAIISQ